MKRLLFLLALISFPAIAQAQETWLLSPTVGQVSRTTKAVTIQNRQTCASMGLGPTCIQADICTAKGLAACTPAQARAANVRIYPNTQPGREEFVTFVLVIPAFQQLMSTAVTSDVQDFCGAFKAASQATRDATCTTYGLPAACEPCS